MTRSRIKEIRRQNFPKLQRSLISSPKMESHTLSPRA
jgi:hypothetical protein